MPGGSVRGGVTLPGRLLWLPARARDTLFELTDALLCPDGSATTLADLTLTAEHRRGHGAMYAALNGGNVDVPRLRQVLAGLLQLEAATDAWSWRWTSPTGCGRMLRAARTTTIAELDQVRP